MINKLRGHAIESINEEWYYSDDKSPAFVRRPCGHCGKKDTKEGYDGCIGKLKEVMNACCGHGEVKEAYVQFNDTTRILGQEALDYIKKYKHRDHRVIIYNKKGKEVFCDKQKNLNQNDLKKIITMITKK